MPSKTHVVSRDLLPTSYTAILQQRGPCWIGWIEEIPGANSQGDTRNELLDNLHSALQEVLEMNRAEVVAAVEGQPYEEVKGTIAG